ncbi:MAG: FmdB family zinc ribbon protein [Caldimonas sp.]
MPIYAYRCSNCGHAQDVLQRMADPVLTTCPACGQATYVKQVTAAGFQLKGSGWYVTDFRGDNKPAKSAEAGDAAKTGSKDAEKATGNGGEKGGDAPAAGAETKSGEAGKKAEAAPVPAAAPSPAPAAPAAPAPPGKTGS